MIQRSFLAIGECMVEAAPARDGLHRIGFAGDTFNTAWYARRLLPEGWRTGYLTAVGEDAVSDEMLAFMAREGIATDSIRRLPDRTVGLYLITLSDGERSFSYWRGQSAARCLADDPAWLEATLRGQGILHFSGITLAILAPEARRTLCRALAMARAEGAMVSFDTNLRPRLWEDTAAMREGLMMGASVADVVLPSFDEEQGLWGDARPSDTVARYREAGAGVVVVKNGGDPGLAWSEAEGCETPFSPTPPRAIVDTTAAGDSFGAAVLAALAQGRPAAEAAQTGAELAAQVIGEPGALAPRLFD